jgi:hypothetical protein
MASQSATVRLGGSLALRIRHPEPDSAIGNPCPHAAGPHWGRGRAEPGGQQRTAGAVRPGHSQVRGRRSNDHAGSLARDLPETVPHVTSRRHTSQPSTTPLTCSVAWVSEVVHGVVNHPSINGMQGVRGSNPLSSTTTTHRQHSHSRAVCQQIVSTSRHVMAVTLSALTGSGDFGVLRTRGLRENLPTEINREPNRLSLGRAASSSRARSLVLPPRPGWRDLAGRCWHARPQPQAPQPTRLRSRAHSAT